MCGLLEMRARIKALDIEAEAVEAFNKNAYYAEDLNVQQLREGRGGKGIMPPYSDSSVNDFGKPPGPIRLYDQGDFYDGITYEAKGNEVIAYSKDKKGDFLESQYADKAPLMLDKASAEDMGTMVQVTMVENISKKLQII